MINIQFPLEPLETGRNDEDRQNYLWAKLLQLPVRVKKMILPLIILP